MEVCTRWWNRHYFKCRLAKHRVKLFIGQYFSRSFPTAPVFPLVLTILDPYRRPRAEIRIPSLFTDRFSRRADMYTATAEEFTAKGTAGALYNQYILRCCCLVSLLFDNGSQIVAGLAQALYAFLRIRKVAMKSFHPCGNGGVERVNQQMNKCSQ